MGIGSILGTIAGIVGMPFTGGTSLALGSAGGGLLDGLSSIFGGASKSSQNQANESDKIKIALENAKLNRDKFALTAPGTRLNTGIKASLASNFTPSTLDWGAGGFKPGAIAEGKAPLPTWKGGVSGGMANLSPDTRALANQVMHDEMVAQMRGGTTGGGNGAKQGDGSMLNPNAKVDGTGTDAAMPTGIGQTSTGDNVLGGLGMGTSILSLLMKQFNKGGGAASDGTTPGWETDGVG